MHKEFHLFAFNNLITPRLDESTFSLVCFYFLFRPVVVVISLMMRCVTSAMDPAAAHSSSGCCSFLFLFVLLNSWRNYNLLFCFLLLVCGSWSSVRVFFFVSHSVHSPGSCPPAQGGESRIRPCVLSSDGLGGASRSHTKRQLARYGTYYYICCALLGFLDMQRPAQSAQEHPRFLSCGEGIMHNSSASTDCCCCLRVCWPSTRSLQSQRHPTTGAKRSILLYINVYQQIGQVTARVLSS